MRISTHYIHPKFNVYRYSWYVGIETRVQKSYLGVRYDGRYTVYVYISSNYGGQVEGMFGDADGDRNNDYTTRQGRDVRNEQNKENLLGMSWKVTNRKKRGYEKSSKTDLSSFSMGYLKIENFVNHFVSQWRVGCT